jgi:hypothetical protein
MPLGGMVENEIQSPCVQMRCEVECRIEMKGSPERMRKRLRNRCRPWSEKAKRCEADKSEIAMRYADNRLKQ